jgi:hypothetical protein
VTLNNSSGENLNALIFEISGKLISTLTIAPGENTFSFEEYKSGFYILQFSDKSSLSSLKILKK